MRPVAAEALAEGLVARHGCHTVLLYGSRARGDASEESDWDLLGVRTEGPVVRDAWRTEHGWLDAFVYPEAELLAEPLSMSFFRLEGARVLVQREGFGDALIRKVEARLANPPEPLPDDEIAARRQWAEKMLERARVGDAEGNFRRAWLLTQLLEDHFVCAQRWYRGPKAAIASLRRDEPELYRRYAAALEPGAPFSAVEDVVAAFWPRRNGSCISGFTGRLLRCRSDDA